MTATDTLSRARDVLSQRFGHRDFRPGQAAIMETVLEGRDVLAVMPTGSGKSLCYQLPAVIREGCALVISPLIALMKDQVDALQAQGIAATYVNSSLTPPQQQERLQACRTGDYDLLYIAPERFRSPRFVEAVAGMRVSLFAIDEAHCISEWGHDFRPDYLRLREAVASLDRPQVLALTATATVDVQQDIVQQLGRPDMQPFVYGFDRPNLVYRVLSLNGQKAKLQALREMLAAQRDGSAIIYTSTRRAAQEVAAFLQGQGAEVLLYHAGLSDAARKQAQDAFMERPNGLIVATNAFGMGIDKADVRWVVHYNLPRSLEAYYQEAGRAGRDGAEAQCLLLFSYGDVRIQEFLVEHNNPTREEIERVYELIAGVGPPGTDVQVSSLLRHLGPGSSAMQLAAAARLLEKAGYIEQLANFEAGDDLPAGAPNMLVRLVGERVPGRSLVLDDAPLRRRRQNELAKVRRMVGYANARQCRRQKILGYFGETWDEPNCSACDHCLSDTLPKSAAASPARTPSEGEWLNIQKILSCVARMRGRYGRTRVVQVLQGSRAREIRGTHLSQLSTYGILKGSPREMIDAYLEALIGAGCIDVVGDEYPKLEITEHGQAAMRRQQDLQLPLLPDAGTAPRQAAPPLPGPRPVPGEAPAPAIPSLAPDVLSATDVQTPEQPATEIEPEYDAVLLQRLQARRKALAEAASLPAYCIVNNRTLRELAQRLPTERQALMQIYGIGEEKARKYGEVLLEEIRDHLAANQASREPL